MRGLTLSVLAASLMLAGCGGSPQESVSRQVDVKAIDVMGKPARCLKGSDIGVYGSGNELTGELRGRFLTADALRAGVRVWTETSSVTTYGSQTIYYTNANDNCFLWAESMSLQEYMQKLGLNPLGISPFYEPEAPKAAPAPTPTPTPTVAPTPAAQ